MIGKTLLRAVLAAALLVPVPSYAGLKVRFINPERYTDAGSFGAGGRDATLAAFRAHLEKLGARLLTPGQNLTIDVLNIDLAGEYEPWRRNLSDVRIMRDVTPPHIKLSYVLNEKGKRTRSDEKKPSRTRLSPSRSSRARTLGKARSTPSRIQYSAVRTQSTMRKAVPSRSEASDPSASTVASIGASRSTTSWRRPMRTGPERQARTK